MTNAHVVASPAQIREVTHLTGPDIYRAASVTRQVYILIGSFPQAGSSGNAFIDLYGQVIGVYFAAESHDSTTGFGTTAAQVIDAIAGSPRRGCAATVDHGVTVGEQAHLTSGAP